MRPADAVAAASTGIRLSKLMAERGLCSRREADVFIERGWVFVDGERDQRARHARRSWWRRFALTKARKRNRTPVSPFFCTSRSVMSPASPEPGFKPAVVLIQPENQHLIPGTSSFQPGHLRGLVCRSSRHRFDRIAGADAGWPCRTPVDRRRLDDRQGIHRARRGFARRQGAGVAQPRAQSRWSSPEAGQGRMAERRPIALCLVRRAQAADSPHVRTCRPACRRP